MWDDLWRINLLKFGSDEKTSGTQKLELVLLDWLDREVAIENVDRKSENRLHELELKEVDGQISFSFGTDFGV